MDTITVADIMTPARDLPPVSEDTTLLDAAEALKKSAMDAPVPLLVAVRGPDGSLRGLLSMVDLLTGLNPKYAKKGFFSEMADKGVSPGLLEMFVERYKLFHEPMEAICHVASKGTVKGLVRAPSKEESVEETAALDVAIDLMVIRRRDYLLVTREGQPVGVLHAAGVYDAIIRHVGLCPIGA